jgi:two-component sensor histidine kinase/PAS domain-containing protein
MNAAPPPHDSSFIPPWDENERLAALAAYDILDTPTERDFDDIVRLAAETFDAPIAVVNLIASGRQWFKAEVGIGARELPLDVSICAHAILQHDTMVVPDTRLDQRFVCNPLVTADDGLRFYAGALLKTPEGLPLGTVCVLDRQPRPDGITEHQRLTIEILARLVMKQLEMRRVIGAQRAHAAQLETEVRERQIAENARREIDQRYKSLFNSLDAGFCIIEMLFDSSGKATDYKFIEVNAAFVAQTGLTDAVGKWMRELAPNHEQHWFDIYGKVALSGEPVRFDNAADALGRYYEVQAFPVGGSDTKLVAILFTDITERRRADMRRNALLAIGDRLRAVNTAPEVTLAASSIVGETLGAVRAGFGRVDASGEFVDIGADWCAAGFNSLAGLHRLSDYGALGDTLSSGRPVVVPDTRIADMPELVEKTLAALGIQAMANVPVRDHNGNITVFFAHSDRPRDWAPEDLTFLRNAGDRVAATVARMDAEAVQQVLNLELSHRMKNTLAMVQAVAKQTLRSVPDQGPVEAFRARMQALSAAHEALLQQNWAAARIGDIVTSVLGAVENIERFKIDGPLLEISARATLSLSLLLHELTTNALKYGALSQPGGTVSVTWNISGEELLLKWREAGGPAVQLPTGKGFGSRLISMGLIGTGGVDLRYSPTGFEADFAAPLAQVKQS